MRPAPSIAFRTGSGDLPAQLLRVRLGHQHVAVRQHVEPAGMVEPVRVAGDCLSFRPADDLGESRGRLRVERWGEGRGLGGGRGRRVARGDEGLGRGVVGVLLRGTRAAENECQRCRERESQQRTFGNHASNAARGSHDRVAAYYRCHRWSPFFILYLRLSVQNQDPRLVHPRAEAHLYRAA